MIFLNDEIMTARFVKRARPGSAIRIGASFGLAATLVLVVACAGPPTGAPSPDGGGSRGVGPTAHRAEIGAPSWYGLLPENPELRFVQSEAEGGSREEALLNAQDRALEEASHQLATMVTSAIDRRIRETRDASLERAKVRVEELNRSDLQVRSSALLSGWKKVKEEARPAAGIWRAWVRLAVPAEHFDMSRAEWFLARAQDAAQLGESTLESCWYQYGVAIFPDHEGLRQAFVDSLRRSGDLGEALHQAVELARRDPSEAHRSQARQLAWTAFGSLDPAGKHGEARAALATLLAENLAADDVRRVRDSLARSARVEAAEMTRRGDLIRARSCLDEALGFEPRADLADEIRKDRLEVDRRLRDPFGAARRRFLALPGDGADPDLLRVRCDQPVLSLAANRLHYSLWTAEPLWLRTLWIEAEAIYSVDYLRSVSGKKVGQGDRPQIARLSVASSTSPGAVDYIVLAGRGAPPAFLVEDQFEKKSVNDPYRESKNQEDVSQAERMERMVAALEAAISRGEIVAAGFQFRVIP